MSLAKLNPQQPANLTMIVPTYNATSARFTYFDVPLLATYHMMALLSKSIATILGTSKTELVLHSDHYF